MTLNFFEGWLEKGYGNLGERKLNSMAVMLSDSTYRMAFYLIRWWKDENNIISVRVTSSPDCIKEVMIGVKRTLDRLHLDKTIKLDIREERINS